MAKGKLTIRQKKFIEAYLQTGNATEAARLAGYGSTDAALAVTGWRMLRNAKIQRHIEQRLAESEVLTNEVIGTLAGMMRSDFTDLLGDDGKLDIDLIRQRGVGHLIKSITYRKGRVARIEMESRLGAISQLSKVLGIEQEPAKNRADLTRRMLLKLIAQGATPQQAAEDLRRMAVSQSDVALALAQIEAHEATV